MKTSIKILALAMLPVAAACGSKGGDVTTPPDTTIVTPPPPPPPPTGGTVNVFAAGNISKCSNGNAAATAGLIDTSAAAVMMLGNAADSGTTADYACYDAAWGKFKTITHPTVGNHDYLLDPTAAPYFAYFGASAGTAPDGWYSFDVGTWHVVVLNTEEGGNSNVYKSGSPQQMWLSADLQAHASAKCTMAVWHRPRFLSSTTAGYVENTTLQSTWAILDGAGVDVILNAGQYQYERMVPLTAAGARDDAKGIVQFNVGLGGESAGPTPTVVSPNSAIINMSFGVLKLTLKDGAYDYSYLTAPGTVGDTGSGICH
ncbi:MAG TPA: hypothetical protein VGI92_02770 [Gemmatimonadales bacterium]